MKKIVILVMLPVLLSGTTFAVGNNSSDIPNSSPMTLSGTNHLIDELNDEADRIDHNNSWEDVDGITNPAVEMILSAMSPQSAEWMSETDLGTYLASRLEIIDTLDRYTRTLPEWDRKTFFQNAEEYSKAMITFD